MSTTLPRHYLTVYVALGTFYEILRVSHCMVPNGNTTAKQALTLKDSRFHTNNTVKSIKALERKQESTTYSYF